jgi:hypothetical protein
VSYFLIVKCLTELHFDIENALTSINLGDVPVNYLITHISVTSLTLET